MVKNNIKVKVRSLIFKNNFAQLCLVKYNRSSINFVCCENILKRQRQYQNLSEPIRELAMKESTRNFQYRTLQSWQHGNEHLVFIHIHMLPWQPAHLLGLSNNSCLVNRMSPKLGKAPALSAFADNLPWVAENYLNTWLHY